MEGFLHSASSNKWLELHGREHWTEFYTDYGVDLQKRFFDFFLKGKKNGWGAEPRVQLLVRHVDKFVSRGENEWPLARTRWTRFYLNPDDMSLSDQPARGEKKLEYEALGKGLTFMSAPLKEETEFTGPIAAKLFVSSSTKDADIFAVFRVFAPDRERGRVSRGHRPSHAGRARLASRIASEARSETEHAVSSVPHARRGAAAHSGQTG